MINELVFGVGGFCMSSGLWLVRRAWLRARSRAKLAEQAEIEADRPTYMKERMAASAKEVARLAELDKELRLVEVLKREFPEAAVSQSITWDGKLLVCAALPNFRDHLGALLRECAKYGYTQTGDANHSKETGTRTYHLGKIRLSVSSQSCQRVKVRDEVVTQPVYEYQCE